MDTREIRKAVRRHPFEPFTLRMNDGREFHVPHPEYVAVARDMEVIVELEDETTTWVEPLSIASLHFGKPKKASKDGKKSGGNP